MLGADFFYSNLHIYVYALFSWCITRRSFHCLHCDHGLLYRMMDKFSLPIATVWQVCFHDAVVLFNKNETVKIAKDRTCTPLPCSWSRGSSKPLVYSPSADTDFKSPKRKKTCNFKSSKGKKTYRVASPYGQRYCPYNIPPTEEEEKKTICI